MTDFFILAGCGGLVGLTIALVVRYLGVKSNPLFEEVLDLTPKANCGACGYAGCAGYVAALLAGKAKLGACPSMASLQVKRISTILGIEVEVQESKVAVVCCSGDDEHATRMAAYNGINNCRDAMQVAAGAKTCTYGCLGLGACARACPFGAIEITSKNIALIHPDLCRGCGLCVQVCPKKLIRLVPKSAPLHIFCSSPEKGSLKRKACKVACIGCFKCMRAAAENQIRKNGFLAEINYADPPAAEIAAVCPTRALRSNIPDLQDDPAFSHSSEVENG